jgi:hypothetical protein
MKQIKVMETYYDITTLYKKAAQSKPRRALFGYMMRTGRTDNTVFGGAFRLIEELEEVPKNDVYKLKLTSLKSPEIVAVAEVAIAGGFNQFAIPFWDIKRTAKALEALDIQ